MESEEANSKGFFMGKSGKGMQFSNQLRNKT